MRMFVKSYIKVALLGFALLQINNAIAQPKIILKLDDLGAKNKVCSAAQVLDILVQRKIKAGIGVIAANLDSTAGQAFDKYLKATNDKGEKLFEVWNHGYDHSGNNPPNKNLEFNGTSFEFQKLHLAQADERVKKLLGVDMHSFGAPNNASDSTCFKVLALSGNYKVFMLNKSSSPETNGIANFNNRVNMEISTGKIDFDNFVAQYQKYKDTYTDLMVLQGHPNMWNAESLALFNKVLDHLIAQQCEFVLPYSYYLSKH